MGTETILRPTELVRGSVRVASPPLIYQRLMEVINHPRGGAGDVADIIREDTGLTARLLRTVNSALYSLPRRIDTVTQAVMVVGTSQVRDLALATSVVSLFRNVPGDLVDMDSFWRHSLACGVAARTLAAMRREENVEHFFVAGVLHDIGKLVLFMEVGDRIRAVLEEARAGGQLMHEVERRVLGFDHGQVGDALLDHWNMPGSLQEAVRFHHAPARAGRYPVEAAAVHVGDILANALRIGSSGECFVPPLVPEAWDALGIDVQLLPSIVQEVERQFEDALHLMGPGGTS